jgi:chromate transporter
MPTPVSAAVPAESKHLRDVALLFLRLGVTAFGGPAAHIALMEDETVTRRKWLSRDEFLDLLGIANLLPGPSSSEMAIYLGFRRAGWPGLVLGGVCFVLPAALLTGLIACAYVRFGSLPQAWARVANAPTRWRCGVTCACGLMLWHVRWTGELRGGKELG